MKTKLIAALTTKFGVTAKVVEGIAEKLSKTISSEEEIETVVNGVTFQQVLESYADKRANEASETARKNAIKGYEDKYGLKDGEKVADTKAAEEAAKKAEEEARKAAEEAEKNKQTATKTSKSEEDGGVPEYIKTLMAAQEQREAARQKREEEMMKTIQSLQGEISGFKTARTLESRQSILNKEIASLSEAQRKPYGRIALDSMSDEDFNTFIEETKANVASITKDAAAAAAANSRPMLGNITVAGKKASDDELKAVMDKI